ncbi:MAG: hypothetical protein VB127_05865 [Sphaerochaeta sp.]|nr:hypothetical protein [Sphaerochaeta sp.]
MQTNLGKDSLPSLLAKLSIPSMIALFSASLYSIADSIFLGRAWALLRWQALDSPLPSNCF